MPTNLMAVDSNEASQTRALSSENAQKYVKHKVDLASEQNNREHEVKAQKQSFFDWLLTWTNYYPSDIEYSTKGNQSTSQNLSASDTQSLLFYENLFRKHEFGFECVNSTETLRDNRSSYALGDDLSSKEKSISEAFSDKDYMSPSPTFGLFVNMTPPASRPSSPRKLGATKISIHPSTNINSSFVSGSEVLPEKHDIEITEESEPEVAILTQEDDFMDWWFFVI